MGSLYALNLFDLAPNDDYRAYSRRSVDAVGAHGGVVVALGRLAGAAEGEVEPRQVMVLVEWPSREAFDAFVADPAHHDLHPLRERGTERYLWWLFDRLDDLRPLFALQRGDGVVTIEAEREIRTDPAAVWDVAADPCRMADWLDGVAEADVDGRLGQGQRHVVRGAWESGRRFEIARVTEDWEPQGYVRWRDLSETIDGEEDDAIAGSWLELFVEPAPTGTRVRVARRQLREPDHAAQTAGAQRLRASLDRLAERLHG